MTDTQDLFATMDTVEVVEASGDVIQVVETVTEIVQISDAQRGAQGIPGPPGDFDQEDLEAAVEDYISSNPLDIDAPDFTAFFENGLS